MSKDIDVIILKINKEKIFDLKKYYEYIDKYGKRVVMSAFKKILVNGSNQEELFSKYFDVYFTFQLNNMVINDDTYSMLIDMYGKDVIDSYFMRLLEVNDNSLEIKEKYEKIYFAIDNMLGSEQSEDEVIVDFSDFYFDDDLVRGYLKEISSYDLLSKDEETRILRELADIRNRIEVGIIDVIDNIRFYDVDTFVGCIATRKQLKQLKKICGIVDMEQRKKIEEYIKLVDRKIKNGEEIKQLDIDSSFIKNIDEQLDLLVNFINIREKIINSNLRLVVSVAKRYIRNDIAFLDLIQEGNLGLIKAVRRFDCSKNVRFSTYAVWWIRQNVSRYSMDNLGIIRMPVHFVSKIYKYKQTVKSLIQLTGEEPTDFVVAEKMGLDVMEVGEIKKNIYNYNSCVSLDSAIGEEEDSLIIDFVADDNNVEDLFFEDELSVEINELLNVLSPREAEVIRYRLGFYGNKEYTLNQVGEIYGLTRERIRQIEKKAMKKLKVHAKKRQLNHYY